MNQELQTLPVPGVEVRQQIGDLETWAETLQIVTSNDYQLAVTTVGGCKLLEKRIKDFFGPTKKQASELHKAICAQENGFLARITLINGMASREIARYRQVEEQKRQAEQRRLQALEDERARKEREALEARAAKAEAKGKEEKAEALKEEAAAVFAPVVQVAVATPRIEGASFRQVWKARIVDAGKLPREWMIPNEAAIQAFARSTKGAVAVPGIEFYSEEIMANRSR